jgi:hypothetical protein
MKITKKWLKENNACIEGTEWFNDQTESNAIKVLEKLVLENKLEWANWTIVRVMKRKQNIEYAIYAAEQVIDNFEQKHPDDKRPREAIEAAKLVLKNNTEKNRATARAAASATARAAASAAAWAAGDAAWAAARATAWAAASAAAWAAGDAARAAWAAGDPMAAMLKKIINNGIEILKRGNK